MAIIIETKDASKAYAYMYVGTPASVATSSTTTEYQVVFDTNGISNNCTPDQNNNQITTLIAGDYLITVQVTFTADDAGDIYVGTIKVDGADGTGDIVGQKPKTRASLGSGNSSHSMTAVALATLTADQDITFWIKNETTGTATNFNVKTCNMSVVQI